MRIKLRGRTEFKFGSTPFFWVGRFGCDTYHTPHPALRLRSTLVSHNGWITRVKIIQITLLAAVLTGCTSAALQQSKTEDAHNIDTAVTENTSPPQTLARTQPSPAEAEIKLPLYEVDARSHHCLAEAMYWEARGEGENGMLAVSSVVLNRVNDKRFPDPVCAVIREGGESPPCQFSWWCDGKSDHPTDRAQWGEILELSYTFLATRPKDPTDGALFYHATYIKSPWRRELTAQIGNHVFYR
jgi:N-acetylmuramoyl-L-alanine amidase